MWTLIGCSAVAALVTRTLTHPLDTLKTRSQVNIQRVGRFKDLYRGLGVSLVFSVPALSIYLSVYDGVKEQLPPDAVSSHAIAAACAETLSGVVW
jgi:solute carrier family 25 iron transporter 28/37